MNKIFALLFLLISFYPFEAYSRVPHYSYNKKIDQKTSSSDLENTLTTEQEILILGKRIKGRIDSLIEALLSEDTPQSNRLEIIQVLQSLNINNRFNIDNQIKIALTQIPKTDIEENKIGKGEKSAKDEELSDWVIYESGWIKVEQAELDKLIRSINTLSIKSVVDLSVAVLIIASRAWKR